MKTKTILFLGLTIGLIACQTEEEKKREKAKEFFQYMAEKNAQKKEAEAKLNEIKMREEAKARAEEEKLGILRIEDLYQEYKSNKLRFEKKYNRKKIKVKGVIDDISRNGMGNVVFSFKYSGFLLSGIYTTLDAEKKLNGKGLLDYNKGDEIVVEGVLFTLNSGFVVSCKDIILKDQSANWKSWNEE